MCAGHTVREVENTINRLYTVRAAGACGSLLFARLSQVAQVLCARRCRQSAGPSPTLSPSRPCTLSPWQGGTNRDTADLTSVILISKNIYGKPIGRRLDLKRILDVGDLGSNIMIKPYDVIYVPRTYISDLNLFITQYLNAITNIKAFADNLRGT